MGTLPPHWPVIPLRRLFMVVNGSTPSSGTAEYWGGEITWVTPNDLGRADQRTIVESQRTLTEAGYRSCGTSLVPPGSLVISTRAPIGHIGIAGVPLCTNQGCRSLVPRGEVDARYFYHCLWAARAVLQSLGQGSTFQELSAGDLAAFKVPCPPVEEQRAIADYLDEKTAAIDTLIDKRERQIRLLAERHTAVVEAKITGRSAPQVKLEDSGERRLGSIPRHWAVVRGKFLFRPIGGYAPAELDHSVSEINYYKVDDLNGPSGEWELGGSSTSVSQRGVRALREPLILFPKRGAAIFTNKVRVTTQPCIFDTNVMGLQPSHQIDAHFLAYALWSRGLGDVADVSTIPQINNKHVNELVFGLPPLEEQKEIVEWLRRFELRRAATTTAIVRQIEKLREYRQALISAAVTGRIPKCEEVPA